MICFQSKFVFFIFVVNCNVTFLSVIMKQRWETLQNPPPAPQLITPTRPQMRTAVVLGGSVSSLLQCGALPAHTHRDGSCVAAPSPLATQVCCFGSTRLGVSGSPKCSGWCFSSAPPENCGAPGHLQCRSLYIASELGERGGEGVGDTDTGGRTEDKRQSGT